MKFADRPLAGRRMTSYLQQPRHRSLVGALLGLLLIGVMIGVMACLPVPVGDPEEAQIDERLTGVWYSEDEDTVWMFLAWNEHNWLIRAYSVDQASSSEDETDELDCEGTTKAWLTTLGGAVFLTQEHTELDSEAGFNTQWMTYRIDIGEDEFGLSFINPDFEALEDLLNQDLESAEVRSAIETVLAQHADNPEMYGEDRLIWYRVPQANYDDIAEYVAAKRPRDESN